MACHALNFLFNRLALLLSLSSCMHILYMSTAGWATLVATGSASTDKRVHNACLLQATSNKYNKGVILIFLDIPDQLQWKHLAQPGILGIRSWLVQGTHARP